MDKYKSGMQEEAHCLRISPPTSTLRASSRHRAAHMLLKRHFPQLKGTAMLLALADRRL